MINKEKHKKDTVSGVKWTVLNQIITQGVTFGLGIILMGLIDPREFGLLGMITVFSGFLSVFKDFGLGSSLIQKKKIDKKEIDTIYWTTVGLGTLLSLLLTLLAPFISNYYEEPRLVTITLVLSSLFIFQSFSNVQMSLARKRMKFKLIFKVNTLAVVVSGMTALILAYSGFGVWALVMQKIIMTFLTSVFFFILSSYKPNFVWKKDILKPHLNFSLPLVGRGGINYWSRNADNFFIGKFLGAELLGIYSRSYSIMMLPVSRLSHVLSSVLFPSLSLIQDDRERVISIFLKLTRTISFISFPLMAVLCLGSHDFVLWLLGDEWLKMIPVLQILSGVGAIQSIATLNGNIFLVKNRTDLALKLNILNSAVYVIGFYFTSQYSLVLLSNVYLFSNMGILFINWYAIEKVLEVDTFTLIKNIGANTVAYLFVLAFGFLLIIPFLRSLQFSNAVNLVCIVGMVGFLWIGMFLLFKRTYIKEFLDIIREAL